jgi:hypothetical protein
MPSGSILQHLLLVLLASLPLWAQDTLPPFVTGKMPPLAVEGQRHFTNMFMATVGVSSIYDNAAAGTSQGGEEFLINSSLALQQTRRHVNFVLSYTPGLMVSRHTSGSGQFTQLFEAEVNYTPTARLVLRLRPDFSVSTDPFQPVIQETLLPQLGPNNQLNDTVVVPGTKVTTKIANAQLAYRMTKHSTLGLTGTFSDQRYDSIESTTPGAGSVSSRAASGSVFYSLQLSARHSAGVQYTILDQSFTSTDAHIHSHSIQIFDQISLTPRSTLTVYAGPQHSSSQEQEAIPFLTYILNFQIDKAAWTPGGGVSYTWNGTRTAVHASFGKYITNGGGLLGPVNLTSGSARVRRQWAQRWSSDIGVDINDNHSLLLLGSALQTNTALMGINVSHELAKDMQMQLSYNRVWQRSSLMGQALGNYDRIGATLRYQFTKPLGR